MYVFIETFKKGEKSSCCVRDWFSNNNNNNKKRENPYISYIGNTAVGFVMYITIGRKKKEKKGLI